MPTLPQQAQEAAEQADSRAPLDEDTYVLRLREVDGSKSGKSGPYWRWEFEVAHNADSSLNGRRLWTNTSLSKKAAWKLKEAFDAFGVSLDTDTDDLCGELCLAVVVQEVIQDGKRAGEIGNQISSLLPIPEGWEMFDDDDGGEQDGPGYDPPSVHDGGPGSTEEEPF